MRHQTRSEPDIAVDACGAIEALISKGVRPRGALRRTARKYGTSPKRLRAYRAQGEPYERGVTR